MKKKCGQKKQYDAKTVRQSKCVLFDVQFVIFHIVQELSVNYMSFNYRKTECQKTSVNK